MVEIGFLLFHLLKSQVWKDIHLMRGKFAIVAVPFASFVLVLLLHLLTSATTLVYATVPEEREQEAVNYDNSPLQISEVPASPFIGMEQTTQTRLKIQLVSAYIQNHNRKLAAEEISNIAQAIVQYGERYGVDYRLLTSIIAIESSFRRDAISSSGAIGMGQLKPDTAKWLGVVNPFDPVDNIAGTARFLGWLVRKYNGNLEYALSAYYQGPGYVDRNGVSSVCLPYLQKVNNALGYLL